MGGMGKSRAWLYPQIPHSASLYVAPAIFSMFFLKSHIKGNLDLYSRLFGSLSL